MDIIKSILWLIGVMLINTMCVQSAQVIIRPELDDDALQCGENYVNITISNDVLAGLGVPSIDKLVLATNESDPYWASDMCTATYDAYGYEFFLDEFYAECAINEEVVDDTAFVYYEVRVVPTLDGVVTRDTVIIFDLHCQYDIKLDGNVGPIYPIPRRKDIIVEAEEEEFEAEMSVVNSNFNPIAGGPIIDIQVGDEVIIGVWLEVPEESDLVLQARTCWATPTADLEDEMRFYFIEDGCLNPDPVTPDGTVVIQNFEDIHVYFSFLAFTWSGRVDTDQLIYVHCWLTVCDPDSETTCFDSGCSKKKRSITMNKDTMKSVTYGPIKIEDNFDDNKVINAGEDNDVPFCDKEKLGCSHECGVDKFGEVLCVCPSGFGLDHNQKSCSLMLKVKTPARHYNWCYTTHLAMLFAVIACIVILLKKISERI